MQYDPFLKAFVHFCFDILLHFHRASSAFVLLGPVKGQQFQVIVEAINSDPFSMRPNRGRLNNETDNAAFREIYPPS